MSCQSLHLDAITRTNRCDPPVVRNSRWRRGGGLLYATLLRRQTFRDFRDIINILKKKVTSVVCSERNVDNLLPMTCDEDGEVTNLAYLIWSNVYHTTELSSGQAESAVAASSLRRDCSAPQRKLTSEGKGHPSSNHVSVIRWSDVGLENRLQPPSVFPSLGSINGSIATGNT
ncbi:hypothetical protein J6590_080205 [Homalodisca vitripennis]|nr:hypothetical protein J6590_080205 [Homalodisca vitripennis]